MSPVNATRMALLSLRSQIGTAAGGARLLRSKRDALLREFLTVISSVFASRSELDSLCREGMASLARALAGEGPEGLRSAALAASRELRLDVEERRVWGVPVPEVGVRTLVRSVEARGYSLAGTGVVVVDETALAFEKILQQALTIASEETRLKRLGGEIRKTSRRVNALEQVLIPVLSAQVTAIQRTLEERAREEVFRLKRLKKRSSR